jgi:hypothetical protein
VSEGEAGDVPEGDGGAKPRTLRKRPSLENSPEQFALNFDRRIASGSLWLGGVALLVAIVTVFLYVTRASLSGSPWEELRGASGWLFLVYLPAAFCSVLLGLFTVWISRDFKRSGALAAIIGGCSVLIILVGYAAAS